MQSDLKYSQSLGPVTHDAFINLFINLDIIQTSSIISSIKAQSTDLSSTPSTSSLVITDRSNRHGTRTTSVRREPFRQEQSRIGRRTRSFINTPYLLWLTYGLLCGTLQILKALEQDTQGLKAELEDRLEHYLQDNEGTLRDDNRFKGLYVARRKRRS